VGHVLLLRLWAATIHGLDDGDRAARIGLASPTRTNVVPEAHQRLMPAELMLS
jgi:hypothetical protein